MIKEKEDEDEDFIVDDFLKQNGLGICFLCYSNFELEEFIFIM